MLEFYYTLIMLISFVGMFVYSKSIPVALVSLYIASWFLPQGIKIVGTSVGFPSILGISGFLYFLYFHYKISVNQMCNRNLIYKSFKYVIILLIFFILIALMSTKIPIKEQFDSIKGFLYYSVNIILAASCFNEKRDFNCLCNYVILLLIISGIYGIYTYVTLYNPFAEYVILTHSLFEDQGMSDEIFNTERGFIHARISGFTVHPLLYGGVLVLCFYLLMLNFINIARGWRKLFLALVLSFCLILIILTGSRSILIGLLCGVVYYFTKMYPHKMVRCVILGIAFFMIFGLTIEDEFIRSVLFFWEDNEEIKGSSSSMRINQIEAAFDVISNDFQSFLFGFGNGWCARYVLKYGNIPPFQGFEGVFISSLVEFGVLGMILYIISLFPPLYRLNSKEVINPKFHILINSFLLSGFIIYSFTGTAYGLRLYVVLTFLIIKYSLICNELPNKINV